MLELSQNSDYPSSKYLNELESTPLPPPPVQSEGIPRISEIFSSRQYIQLNRFKNYSATLGKWKLEL